jgi:hypothetical protein
MVDLSYVLEALSGASTIAVILGIPFIVLQMRQNGRMVEAANRQAELVALQNRSQVVLAIAEQLTDRDFIFQRKAVHDLIPRQQASRWEGFVESADGFEVRALAVQYESIALMAKLGIVEASTLHEALGYTIIADWRAVAATVPAFEKAWGMSAFPNFRALAEGAEKYWKDKGAPFPSPPIG